MVPNFSGHPVGYVA